MKLDGVAAFVAVAKTGSISEAARYLRLSKSAVSERLSELERALDANLIQRNSRQLALTEDGAAFLKRAQRIVTEAEEAANELAQRRGEISGPLRIACPRGLADTHLAAPIFSFMERNPDDWSFRVANDLVVARVDPRLRVTSCTAMRDAAVAGLGIASLPTFHCSDGIRNGSLEILNVGADDDVTPITLAYQNGVKPSAKLSALIEHLKREIGNPPYWDEGLPITQKP